MVYLTVTSNGTKYCQAAYHHFRAQPTVNTIGSLIALQAFELEQFENSSQLLLYYKGQRNDYDV